MSLATRSTTAQAKELATELSSLLVRAEAACQNIESHTLKMEKKHKHVAGKIEIAQSEVELIMRDVLEQHKKHVAEVIEIIKQPRPKESHTQGKLDRPQQIKFKTLVETNKQRAGMS